MGHQNQKMTTRCHTTTIGLLPTACLAVFTLILGSCGSQKAHVPFPLVGQFKRLSPTETGCVAGQGMQFRLEQIIIRPDTVQPGEEINQQLFYVLCAPSLRETLKVRVTRVLFFAEKEASRDVTLYEFVPGAWTVGIIFVLPKNSPSGAHKMETTVEYQNQTEKRSTPFSVKKSSSQR